MKYKVNQNVLYYGILAGIIGAVVQNIFTRPLVWFHIIDAGVLEQAKKILLSQNMTGYLPSLIGLIGHLLYSGLWGGIFALLITKYPGHRYFMGTGMGLAAWMTIMFISTTLGKHEAGQEEALHALFLLIGGALYGITTAWAFDRLTKKSSLTTDE